MPNPPPAACQPRIGRHLPGVGTGGFIARITGRIDTAVAGGIIGRCRGPMLPPFGAAMTDAPGGALAARQVMVAGASMATSAGERDAAADGACRIASTSAPSAAPAEARATISVDAPAGASLVGPGRTCPRAVRWRTGGRFAPTDPR